VQTMRRTRILVWRGEDGRLAVSADALETGRLRCMTAVLRGLACTAALRHMEVHARNHFGVVERRLCWRRAGLFRALQQQSRRVV